MNDCARSSISKTQNYTATSFDGFTPTEEDSLEWLLPLGDVGAAGYPEFIAGVGALAMGSTTYEWMLRNTEQVVTEVGSAWPHSQPTWVFNSRTLARIYGVDLRFVRGGERAPWQRDAVAEREARLC